MAASNLPLKKWAYAFYLMMVHPKGVSSIQMAKHIGVTQKTAWFIMHKIRECWDLPTEPAEGPVEVDETYVGGLNKNRHYDKKLKNITGSVGKTPVLGMRDRATGKVRAKVIHTPDRETLSGYVNANIGPETIVFPPRMTRSLNGRRPGRGQGAGVSSGSKSNGVAILFLTQKGTSSQISVLRYPV